MLTTSVVLGPTVGMMRGVRGGGGMPGTLGGSSSSSAFWLHRSLSNVATTSASSVGGQSSYFYPLMGLFGAGAKPCINFDLEEADSRSESSGSASGTHGSVGRSSNGSVNGGRNIHAVKTSHGPNKRRCGDNNQARLGQLRAMEMNSSRPIVEDYVRHCLYNHDVQNRQNGQGDAAPSDAQRAMRGLGERLEESFGANLDRLINDLHLTPQNGQDRLTTVMEELFADEQVNWGRVACLVKFAGKLAVHCARDEAQPQLVDSIVDWVSLYVDSRLGAWIAENGGWAGLVRFYQDRDNTAVPSLRRLLTVGVAAAGLLTLGALWRS